MKKTIEIEYNGITNSARAITNNNEISISKLMELEGLSMERILSDIFTLAEYDETPNCLRPIEEITAEKILNVLQVARAWHKDGYKLIK